MQISKICEQCGETYTRPPSLAKRSKFCSKSCYDKSQSTREIRKINCEACGCEFSSKDDHGVYPKFCSRKCFLSKCLRPVEKKCAQCGHKFVATRSGSTGTYRKFCSKKCYTLSQTCQEEVPCADCGKPVFVTPSRLARSKNIFCNNKCSARFYSGSKSNFYNEGERYTGSTTGHVYIFRDSRWVGEHRIVAAEIMGRDLRYWSEPIIHLNGVPDDNRPENLYVFPSMSELTKCLRHGVRPSESNIKPKIYKGT